MQIERARSFDAVAESYDRFRPRYPESLFEDLFACAQLPADAQILEIGCGSGIATLPLAKRGFPLMALDPGRELVRIARSKLERFENCRIYESAFEDFALVEASLDLICCAQAFHWLDADSRFERTACALKASGALAIFGNVTLESSSPLRQAIQEAYQDHAPQLEGPSSTSWYAQGGPIEDLIQASGLFMPPESRFYDWSKTYSTADYLGLLRTHSDHNLLSEGVRAALLRRIGDVIDQFGGTIEIDYQSSLYFARRLTRTSTGITST